MSSPSLDIFTFMIDINSVIKYVYFQAHSISSGVIIKPKEKMSFENSRDEEVIFS
jgi:hypothetical protein